MGLPDPFTRELIASALTAAAEEMFAALGRTSMSPVIYEVLDYACGITDPDGGVVAQASGVTGFQGLLGHMVREAIRRYGRDGLRPGDLVIANDPYAGGGTHPNDVGLIAPVWVDGALVAYVASKAHWGDVGGQRPGSWSPDAREVFQEGLVFPFLLLRHGGRFNQALLDVIAANVRDPAAALSDLHAQIAALGVAARRIEELCRRYGREAVAATVADLHDRAEAYARRRLAELPRGEWFAEGYLDDDGCTPDPVYVCCRVRIDDQGMTVDFTGSSPQRPGPVNSSLSSTEGAVRTAYLFLVDPWMTPCEGAFRPLRVIAPPGSVFAAQRPAPTSSYWEAGDFATDLVWRALAPALPERLPAGHFLSVCGTILSGRDAEGRLWVLVEPQPGGWGGGPDDDGASALVCSGDGDTLTLPVEVAEQRYPLRVERFALNVEPGGEGRYRGGCGVIREYRVLAEEAELTVSFGRHRFPPWGVHGGRDGTCNRVEVYRARPGQAADGPARVAGKLAGLRLARGDCVRLVTGVGGGYGPPAARDPARVCRDLRDGLLSPERARTVYGLRVEGG